MNDEELILVLKDRYDYTGGRFINKWKFHPQTVVGAEAGRDGKDYRSIGIRGKVYLIHRLVWLWHHGTIPHGKHIDHIDGNRLNNEISNLRLATRSENLYNRKVNYNSASGVKNVSWRESTKKWRVQISVYGKKRDFGQYDELELAELVAQEARHKYHGEFANNG